MAIGHKSHEKLRLSFPVRSAQGTENKRREKYENVERVKGKELWGRNLQECENKRVVDFAGLSRGRDVNREFTRHDSTDVTILKVKYIEWGFGAANGEKSRLNGNVQTDRPDRRAAA